MELMEILQNAVLAGASDIFIVAGCRYAFKIQGRIEQQGDAVLMPDSTRLLVDQMYETAGRDIGHRAGGDDDFAVSVRGVGRFRINVYKQRGAWSAVLRVVAFGLPDITQMGIPGKVLEFAKLQKGLVLVTGSAGSGKSTTLAYIIDEINRNRNCHILTLEDPIEFLHRHNRSIVSQREIGIDFTDYSKALRAAMREAPDVILIGEMRDNETIETAMTAAETGHLVLSTLHTIGAANTIDRIIDVFPSNQQQQIRIQLSMVLRAIVSQQLIPSPGGMKAAFEIMEANNAIRTMIRDSKVHQLESVIFASAKEGMKTMDSSILELYKSGAVDAQSALMYCMNKDTMRRNVGL